MIFYFTGTGNSLYAAKHFDKELYSIPKEMKKESRKYTAGSLCREN
jgi:flavodoxin